MTNQMVVTQEQSGFMAPVANIQTALSRYQMVKEFIDNVLKKGVDYGEIPGTDKPALLKPGAEKMCTLFGLHAVPVLREKIADWTGKDHDGEPFFYYRYSYQLWRDGVLIAEGEGSCNSWEKKYRYRQADRICPKCGKPAIVQGKKEYGGGWLCFAKKGGCGAKFAEAAPEITSQITGQIKNPDVFDLVNTIEKMAQKRALIAPVLIATNTSDYFTQDIDDFIEGTFVETKPATPEPVTPAQEYQDTLRKVDKHNDELRERAMASNPVPPPPDEFPVDEYAEVDDHPENKPCPVHDGELLIKRVKGERIWYSHKTADGWCNGVTK